MSRASPFPSNPSRRPKSPAAGPPSSSVQPLSINRPPSRPQTPGNTSTNYSVSSVYSASPARPARSDLRARVPSQNSSANVSLLRESSSTISYADGPVFGATTARQRPSTSSTPAFDRQNGDPDALSPSQLKALSAFKQAGVRRARRDSDRDEERRKELEREEERQRKLRERSMSRKTNGKAKPGDIDAILEDVKYEWETVLDPDFNPVDLALFLLDEQARDQEVESFQRTKLRLEKALKGTIDKNYRAFEAALPHHNSLLHSLGQTQSQVSSIRISLQEVKESLGNKRADLVQLWSRGQQVEEMMKILDQIEYLKSVPDTLESLMSEKRLLQASALLISSLKVIAKPDMLEIGALADLRSYLVGQENSLREILIEELHSHLYLKSFWCDSRWSPYSANQQALPIPLFEEGMQLSDQDTSKSRHSRLFQYLHELTLRPNETPYEATVPDFESQNNLNSLPSARPLSSIQSTPESDSFSYIESLLESLAVLGKLAAGLDIVAQRLPSEIFNLVENTISEVNDRVQMMNRMSLMEAGRPSSVYSGIVGSNNADVKAHGLRLAALEMTVKERSKDVLSDLFWTLYSKLDAVIQGLRVLSEVANRIGARRNYKDNGAAKPSTLFPLNDQWLPLQAEIRSLLHDYLVDEQSGAAANRNPISSINQVLKQSKDRPILPFRNAEQRKVFRFVDTDPKFISKLLKVYEEHLTKTLYDTVPGLASTGSDAIVQTAFSAIGTDDRLSSAGQHQVLLPPDAFHVRVLFQPTLAFLDGIVEILPSGIQSAHAVSTFLDDFVLNVYLPQLEEKVTDLFHLAVSGPEAFREDISYYSLFPQPLIKASVQIASLANSLCAMLQTTPFHKENYSRLILGIIVQFYQQCNEHFRDLVARDTLSNDVPPIVLAAQWSQSSDVSACLNSLFNAEDENERQILEDQEINLELSQLGETHVTLEDIIPSIRDLRSMCGLYTSLIWFIQQLTQLRPTEEPATPNGLPESSSAYTPLTPHIPIATILKPNDPLQLPLSREMTARFTTILKTFQQLASGVLFTIRLDIRCRILRFLDQMARRSNYQLDQEVTEPDHYVIELNTDLAKCDEATCVALGERERKFVFDGIGNLICRLLIFNSRHIHFVNENGMKKMQRNILALQQNLKTIQRGTQDSQLDRAKKYWELYQLTPQQLLVGVRQKRAYTFNEYEAMLSFICGVDPHRKDRGTTDKDYNLYLIDLHELAGHDP